MASGSSDNRINSLIWGVVLALAGIGLLLFNLDLFVRYEPYVQYVASALLGLLALGFIGSYVTARFSPAARREAGTSGGLDYWWRLIPAWTLIALAVMVFLTTLPALDQRVTAGVPVRRSGDCLCPHLPAGPGRALVGDHPRRIHADVGRYDCLEQPQRGSGSSGHGAFHRPGGRLLSALPIGAAAAAVVGADSRLSARTVWPISLFRQQRGTASDSALVAAAAAAAGRVVDLACNAPPPQPQAVHQQRSQSIPLRAASRPRATLARAGWANTAVLPPAPRWRCCPTRRKHSKKQFGGEIIRAIAPY